MRIHVKVISISVLLFCCLIDTNCIRVDKNGKSGSHSKENMCRGPHFLLRAITNSDGNKYYLLAVEKSGIPITMDEMLRFNSLEKVADEIPHGSLIYFKYNRIEVMSSTEYISNKELKKLKNLVSDKEIEFRDEKFINWQAFVIITLAIVGIMCLLIFLYKTSLRRKVFCSRGL